MFARLSSFDSAKQGRQEAQAGSLQDNTHDVPSNPRSKGGKKPKQEAPKTTRKTCHRLRQAREARSPESRKPPRQHARRAIGAG